MGKARVLQFIGLQRVRHDLATEQQGVCMSLYTGVAMCITVYVSSLHTCVCYISVYVCM